MYTNSKLTDKSYTRTRAALKHYLSKKNKRTEKHVQDKITERLAAGQNGRNDIVQDRINKKILCGTELNKKTFVLDRITGNKLCRKE